MAEIARNKNINNKYFSKNTNGENKFTNFDTFKNDVKSNNFNNGKLIIKSDLANSIKAQDPNITDDELRNISDDIVDKLGNQNIEKNL